MERGGRASSAVVRRMAGRGSNSDRDGGFEDGLFETRLAGNLVAVVAEALAEVVQLGKRHVAHVAVEAVLPGEGRDGERALAEEDQQRSDGERDCQNLLHETPPHFGSPAGGIGRTAATSGLRLSRARMKATSAFFSFRLKPSGTISGSRR